MNILESDINMNRLFLFLLLITTLGSCRTHVCSITDTTAIHDTTYITRHHTDSIYLHDSIYHEVLMKGDTVYVRNNYYHTAYRDKARVDTFYQTVRDTVTHVATVEKAPQKIYSWRDLLIVMIVPSLLISFLIFILYKFNTY